MNIVEKNKDSTFCIKISNLFSRYNSDVLTKDFEDKILFYSEGIGYEVTNGNVEYVLPTFELVRKIPVEDGHYVYEYKFKSIYTNNYNALDPLIKNMSYLLEDELFGEKVELNIYIFRKYGLPVGGYRITHDRVELLYCSFNSSVSYKMKEDGDDNSHGDA